ncbi:MAG TPA: ABC transporter substrate-binding protein [Desulfatiglandales bacterium]
MRVVSIAMLVLSWAVPVWAGVPTEKVKETADKIIAIVSDPSLKEPAKEAQRRERIRRTVDEMCDWEEMSRRSLGRHWAQRSEQEKKEFVHLFGQLLERTYIDKVEGYSGEKVNYVGERIDGDYAEVDVKVVTKKNTEIPVMYKLKTRDQKWWVYDMVIEGVSLVNNYRTQFSDILAKSSYEGLVKKLKEKVTE